MCCLFDVPFLKIIIEVRVESGFVCLSVHSPNSLMISCGWILRQCSLRNGILMNPMVMETAWRWTAMVRKWKTCRNSNDTPCFPQEEYFSTSVFVLWLYSKSSGNDFFLHPVSSHRARILEWHPLLFYELLCVCCCTVAEDKQEEKMCLTDAIYPSQ